MPLAPSAVAPVAMHTRHDLRRVIATYEQRIFTLEIELAKNEASAVYATDAMRGALEASKLEHALRALVATERGRSVLKTAVRPARGDADFNAAAAVVRRILEL